MSIKKYIDKDGNEKTYVYDDRKYYGKYNQKRNNEIYKLQKRKSYYKKKGDLERVKTLDILIGIEKRRMEIEKKEKNHEI